MTKGKRGGKISPATEFKPGRSGNPKGRPRRYVALSNEQADKLSQINQCIQEMMVMEQSELDARFERCGSNHSAKDRCQRHAQELAEGKLVRCAIAAQPSVRHTQPRLCTERYVENKCKV